MCEPPEEPPFWQTRSEPGELTEDALIRQAQALLRSVPPGYLALNAPTSNEALREVRLAYAVAMGVACPTCHGTGPDVIDRVGDYGGDVFEARCGDEWHDGQGGPHVDPPASCDEPTG